MAFPSRLMVPDFILRIRHRNCAGCQCELDKAEPCAACPRRKWGPFICGGGSRPGAAGTGSPSTPITGPGSRLKAILGRLGIKSMGGCRCNARAREMDLRGPDWCLAHIDQIVLWLREEATRRKLFFADWPARLLIRLAIAQSRSLTAPARHDAHLHRSRHPGLHHIAPE